MCLPTQSPRHRLPPVTATGPHLSNPKACRLLVLPNTDHHLFMGARLSLLNTVRRLLTDGHLTLLNTVHLLAPHNTVRPPARKGRWWSPLNTGGLLMLPNMDNLPAINTGRHVPKSPNSSVKKTFTQPNHVKQFGQEIHQPLHGFSIEGAIPSPVGRRLADDQTEIAAFNSP